MPTVLKTEKVTKIYALEDAFVTAVNQLSIDIQAGEFVALVGPSGSGKTTMLAMLAGLLAPSYGRVFINGADISQMSEFERTAFRRQKIGFTFQTNNLIPYLNVLENVELMLKLNKRQSKTGREQAKDLLVRLGLGERLYNLPYQLSGGQQQRVAIARSLIHDPEVVLADEPTASLDTERAYQVVQTFADLIHEQKRIGIMVTHDLRICRFVDRVIQMVDGNLDKILTDPVEIRTLAGANDTSTIKKHKVFAD